MSKLRGAVRKLMGRFAGARIVQQHATGDTVVQVGGDAGTVIAGDVNIYPQDTEAALSEPAPSSPESEADRTYREHAMRVSATGGEGPAVRIVARFPGIATRFDTADVSTVQNIAYQYLNVYTAGLPVTAKTSAHADFETHTADGRHIMMQVLQNLHSAGRGA